MAAAYKSIKIKVEDLDAEEESKESKKTSEKKSKAASSKSLKTKKTPKKSSGKKITEKKADKISKPEKITAEIKMTAAKAALAKEIEKAENNELTLIEKAKLQDEKSNEDKSKNNNKDAAPSPNKDVQDDDPVLKVVNSLDKEKISKEEAKETEKIGISGHSLKLYRKIAYFFIFLTLILIAAVLYFTMVKIKIVIIPKEEKLSNNMIFDVYDFQNTGIDSSAVSGVVKKVSIQNEKTYESSGEKIIGEETVGTVKLINNYSKNQQLVATTRLLSSNGKLFRLKDTVNVPSGSEILAEVYADEPGRESAIGPAKFTIPGLWAGLQDKIYAESTESFEYRQKVEKYIQESDIENGIRDLKQQLLAKTKSEIDSGYGEYNQVLYSLDDNSIKTEYTGKAGDVVDGFNISISADVVVVAFSEDKAKEIARQKFISSLPQNKEAIEFNDSDIIYSLSGFDADEGTAVINSNFVGKAILKENSQIIDIERILGLNNEQLRAYLKGLPELEGFEVEYFPSFIKRVPSLVDRINIEIKK